MSELYLKNEEQFTNEFEAFLSKIRSVPDVMLEDFNRKFKLGISLEERLFPEDFIKRARKLNNQEAISFFNWWKNELEQIRSSTVGPLFDLRNISIHRKTVTTDLKRINVTAKISCFAEIAVYDAKGNLVSKSSSIRPQDEKPEPPKIEWSFKEYPNDNALDISKKLFSEIERMLKEAQLLYSK